MVLRTNIIDNSTINIRYLLNVARKYQSNRNVVGTYIVISIIWVRKTRVMKFPLETRCRTMPVEPRVTTMFSR